ncbi:MAG: hypothetical protein K2I96_15495 [Lachnospiraceae bacterium]|nr:hypothetical protein [Lachnospiraceae bacterium]
MWWKIVLIIIVLAFIGGYWVEKCVKSRKRFRDRRKRRTYKFFMGLTYLITAGVSFLLVKIGGSVLYLYTIFGLIFAIGSFLSAINCNLRNIYSAIAIGIFIMWAVSPYFNNHKIIFSILDIYLAVAVFCSVKESIENIYYGVDPDLIEEEKEEKKKWKRRFKQVKCLVKLWL